MTIVRRLLAGAFVSAFDDLNHNARRRTEHVNDHVRHAHIERPAHVQQHREVRIERLLRGPVRETHLDDLQVVAADSRPVSYVFLACARGLTSPLQEGTQFTRDVFVERRDFGHHENLSVVRDSVSQVFMAMTTWLSAD